MHMVHRARPIPRWLANRIDAAWEESGQALIEYALILGFVATVAVVGLTSIGLDVAALLSKAEAGFP